MPKTENQFVVQFDGLRRIPQGVEWHGRIELWHESESRMVKMTQRVVSAGPSSAEVTTSLNVGSDDAAIVVQVPKKKLVREQGSISVKLGEQAQVSWTSARKWKSLNR